MREGKSERTRVRQTKARANVRIKRARASLPILRNEQDRWKNWTDGARRIADVAKKKMDNKANELDVKLGEKHDARIANKKAQAEYNAYQANYNEQESGEI